MLTETIEVFNKKTVNEGDVLFVKVEDNEYKKALVETIGEKFLKLIYIDDSGACCVLRITISDYLEDRSKIKIANCYMK